MWGDEEDEIWATSEKRLAGPQDHARATATSARAAALAS